MVHAVKSNATLNSKVSPAQLERVRICYPQPFPAYGFDATCPCTKKPITRFYVVIFLYCFSKARTKEGEFITRCFLLFTRFLVSGLWLSQESVGDAGVNHLGYYTGVWNPEGSAVVAHGFTGALHLWRRSASLGLSPQVSDPLFAMKGKKGRKLLCHPSTPPTPA